MPAIDKVEREAVVAALKGNTSRRKLRTQGTAFERWPVFEPAFWGSLTEAAQRPAEADHVKNLINKMYSAGADSSPSVLRNLESLYNAASATSRRGKVMH